MKKVLSLILALTFVVSLMPAALGASVNDAGNTVYNYVFTTGAIGLKSDVGIDISGSLDNMASPLGGVMDYDDIVPSVSDKWDLIALRSAHARQLHANGLYFRAQAVNVKTLGANGILMKINVPETGKYIPTASFDGAKNGGIAEVYFISAQDVAANSWKLVDEFSIQNVVQSKKVPPLGAVDTYSTSGTDAALTGPVISESFEPIDIAAGDHYLVFALKDVRESLKPNGTYPANIYMETRGFSLEKIAPAKVEITAAATELEAGGTTTVSASVLGANSEVLPDAVTFESSAPSVATVDAVTGEVSAKSAGSATITAKVSGTNISASATITVTNTYKYIFSGTACGYANGTDFNTGDKIDYTHVEEKGISSPWDYISQRSSARAQLRTNGFYSRTTTGNLGSAKNGLVFKIKVSQNGVYVPTLKYSGHHNGGTVAIYLAPAKEVEALSYNMTDVGGGGGIVRAIGKYAPVGSVYTKNTAITNENFGTITPATMGNVNLTAGEYYLIFYLPNATETPTSGSYLYFLINSLELKKIGAYTPEEDSELLNTFDYVTEEFSSAPLSSAKVNVFGATLGESADSSSAVITSKTVNLGELCEVTAPEAEEGYKFLYWAKGMSTNKKQIVSYDEKYSFIPTVENTYLIAVYESTSGEAAENKAEFYNANGQLIKTLTADGKAPALPEMAGYDAAEGWALYGSDEVISGGDPVVVSGTKLYVAKYGEKKSVKVNGENVPYGEAVTFTAEPAVGQIFKGWARDGVIVSTNEVYTVRVWEDCSIEPVYVTSLPNFTGKAMKILIDTFSVGGKEAVMAEFIGVGNAVEKGIVFGNKRIAMTTGESQFTVINDENETDVKGYVIFKDGTIIYDK